MKENFMKYLLLILVLSIGCTVSVLAIGSYGINLDSAGYITNTNPFYRQGLHGQCTWYCWGRAYEKGVSLHWGNGHFGNAIDWYNNASGSYVCDGTPSANSIKVSPDGGYWNNGLYYQTGHVIFVEKVEGNFAYISEHNYPRNKVYHEDIIDLSTGKRNSGNGSQLNITGYIHLTPYEPIAPTISLPFNDPTVDISWNNVGADSYYIYVQNSETQSIPYGNNVGKALSTHLGLSEGKWRVYVTAVYSTDTMKSSYRDFGIGDNNKIPVVRPCLKNAINSSK